MSLPSTDTGSIKYLFNACSRGKCFDFTAASVEQHYRDGSGAALTVQVLEVVDLLDDPGVTWSRTSNPDRFVLSTFGLDGLRDTSQSRVLGQVTVQRIADGAFRVLPDFYNFERHDNPTNDFSIARRNAATSAGGAFAGPGSPFVIRFTGTFTPTSPAARSVIEGRRR